MNDDQPTSYKQSGVDAEAASRTVKDISYYIRKTFELRPMLGKTVLDIGYFANVIDLGNNLGLAISTDGVGTKILIAQAMEKYDTVGIDCVAMNVNDVLCVGAEPLSLVDYIAVEIADPAFITELIKGFYAGAVQANITIPGGEIAQVKELIHGSRDGKAFDLVGTCVGTVPLNRVLTGRDVRPGDVVVGMRSSGVHSNGFTLARRVLLQNNSFSLHEPAGKLERPLGEELLEPTMIYVKPVIEMLNQKLDIKALAHITGDGLMNLARVDAEIGFCIDQLPPPQPIFDLIQTAGDIADQEMYYVFNMGIGFCIVLDAADADKAIEISQKYNIPASIIGQATEDAQKKVVLPQKTLIGVDGRFFKS
jgi:phosphoribosylformylglycinamidine cyclo-ligase